MPESTTWSGRSRTARFGHAILERPNDLAVARVIARLSLRKSLVFRSRPLHSSFPKLRDRPRPTIACTMKSFLPLQFPETTNPTSLHGVPVRSKPIAGSVSRAHDRLRSHGAPCTAAHASPGFPVEGSAVAQVSCAADLLRRPVSRAEQHIQPRSPPAHVELASPLRSPGSAMRALRHGLLELVMPVFFARLPEHHSPASLRAVRV
jgi:hypothetical protein